MRNTFKSDVTALTHFIGGEERNPNPRTTRHDRSVISPRSLARPPGLGRIWGIDGRINTDRRFKFLPTECVSATSQARAFKTENGHTSSWTGFWQ